MPSLHLTHQVPPQLLSRAAGSLSILLLSALIAGTLASGRLTGAGALLDIAAIAAVALALLRLDRVSRIARIFLAAAALSVALVAMALPEAMPAMRHALMQGTAFSAFLTALALIRAPVRGSKAIGRAAEALFAHTARVRILAVSLGAQAISVLFNIGTIGMISDIAADHDARRAAEGRRRIDTGAMTLAALRGTLMMTVWSPIGLGFAIVTSSIPTLDPVLFLALALAAALTIAVSTALLDARKAPAPSGQAAEAPPPGSAAALVAVLAAVAGLVAVTILLHRLLDISFLVAACIVLPLLAVIWPRIERGLPRSGGGTLARVSAASEGMATESTIFLAAAVIGAAVAQGAQAMGINALIERGSLPPLAVILACLLAIPAAGALMIPHSIVMVMAAQLFGASPVGAQHPYALGLALCLAWALAISASPISAMSIITGRQLNRPPHHVTFRVNRGFTLVAMSLALAMTALVYVVE
ncbi:hypothetical protein [Rhodovulum kholense]|uniref:Uncharacterized protein n=1 Tax=Rhodovulum kholense TaxID=453584 RepID=A0A8E2VKS8_9RHOB|nr:hypothetical protein [Rhodovulum kholense]PTW50614.1 hypothetical protein C8N38_104250 [Rhodovulum kholense]